ncbi:hypothetical protein HBH98_128110 [Parastagonospora nodorum]|nr:hypothetical protein HBH53_035390 [Parastagonospora nodorum]KAH3984528.1 hypothetical protein HBH51_025520 [Parastagonospora nodorum]KAH4036900.1 hypothetical protein HBI09_078830 [Parastagonospora nodorum]KAH4051692.1 hypothetical protein HBH49_106800 [Parastagonospora nodorum]KAH4344775.1 hypothetical protein HBH98_128110 [Parastagonospora nodorum]
MPATNHYTALGLVPSAAPEVIRAAYKALALICHPGKTMHLAARERASRAAAFNEVQVAYDVLGNPAMKAAYDAQLSPQASRIAKASAASDASSSPSRRSTVKLTTPEEKTALRAKARQSLEELLQKRQKRDAQESELDVVGLRDLAQTWTQLAEENSFDPAMRAHCAIRIHEYEQKIAQREREHEEWLSNMSTAKQGTYTPASASPERRSTPNAPKKPTLWRTTTSAQSSPATPSRATKPTQRAEERKRIDDECKAAETARSEARLVEKAKREAAKQALLDQKAAAIRVEKEKLQARIDLQARTAAERIAKVRAKAGAAPLGTVGAVVDDPATAGPPTPPSVAGHTKHPFVPVQVKKVCDNCDAEHATFRDWRACNAHVAPVGDVVDG